MNQATIYESINRLDHWLDTMLSDNGYKGPIVHWWESSLVYCGVMFDWRYEGILCGYVQLYRVSSQLKWLEKAIRIADSICANQLASSNFRNSSFQIGPIEAGTPHESAVDVGLLELAKLLKESNDERWYIYFNAAERNLQEFHFKKLWDGKLFRDQAWNQTYVPNKNSTILEALLLYEELGGEVPFDYITPIVDIIKQAQVQTASPANGGIVHMGTGQHRLAIGIYSARCANALLRLYSYQADPAYLDIVEGIVRFLNTLISDRGTAFGYYPNGKQIQCPTWISPSGDILRTYGMAQKYFPEIEDKRQQVAQLLLAHQYPSGAIQTSIGLARKGNTKSPDPLPDFRDLLPVVGWCDKAFRSLTLMLSEPFSETSSSPMMAETRLECKWKGQLCTYIETPEFIALESQQHNLLYRWYKTDSYPETYRL